MRGRQRRAPRGTGLAPHRLTSSGAAPARAMTAPPVLTVVPPAPVAEERRTHRDPNNFPVNLPEPGSGIDRFRIRIPAGLRFALVDLDVSELSPLADLEIIGIPAPGAEGEVEIAVRWSHAPYGGIAYTLKVYANPEARPPVVLLVDGSTGFAQRSRALIRQDAPISVEVRGMKADALRVAVERAAAPETPSRAMFEPVTIAIVALGAIGIAALGAILIALGLFVFYSLVQQAMQKEYDIQDTGFKAAMGEGESRTEQAMVFNLKKRVA
jgi:hypothetical protein